MNIYATLRRALILTGIACASASAQTMPLQGEVMLNPKLLIQLVLSRSAEVKYSSLQVDVAGQLSQAEAALYEAVFYNTVRYEDRQRQRTVEETIASLATSQITVLNERVRTAEAGLRSRLPSGAEVSLAYRLTDTRNNIIASASPAGVEYNGALVLTLKQPLLRGAGRDVIETDRQVAATELKVVQLQYQQQLLKTCNDALAIYWQLYRAIEVQRIRQQAFDYAGRIQADTQARIEAGKLPSSNQIEARAAVLLRDVELVRSTQGVREAESRLLSVLNISNLNDLNLKLVVRDDVPAAADFASYSALARYRSALSTWPGLRIAQLRIEQARMRLNFADNQRLPEFDFFVSHTDTGLASENKVARSITESGKYPEWIIGLTLEVPLAGNQKAQSQYLAQSARVRQSELELESMHSTLANDISTHYEQAVSGQTEVSQMRRDVELRSELLSIERVRYEAGLSLLTQLLQRETDLTDSRQRLIESTTRLGQAYNALLFSDGSLLQEYGITLKE